MAQVIKPEITDEAKKALAITLEFNVRKTVIAWYF